MILDHFADEPVTLDRARTYDQSEPFKPGGLWVSVRGDDDWPTWCRDNQYGLGDVHHEVTLAADANIFHISTPTELDMFYTFWRIPEDRYYHYRHLKPDYINWAEFTKTCDGIIIAPYQWSNRLGHMWYYGWDCASGCIWNPNAIATIEIHQPCEEAAR